MAKSTPPARGKAKAAKASATSAKKAKATTIPATVAKEFVGRRVAKDFDGSVYEGVVDSYLARYRLWGIKYDDGDAEELAHDELIAALDLFDERNARAKKEKKPTTAAAPAKPVNKTPDKKKSKADGNGKARGGEKTPKKKDDAPQSSVGGASPKPAKQTAGVVEENNNSMEIEADATERTGGGAADVDADMNMVRQNGEGKRKIEVDKEGGETVGGGDGDTSDGRFFGKVERAIEVIDNLFRDNPCRVPGGHSRPPQAYPNHDKGTGSFGFLIQRLSDRNYAMRSMCLDGHGAEYTTYKKADANYISCVWYPKRNLKDHVNDETIIDGCHLDLINPENGQTYLTGEHIQSAIAKSEVLGKHMVECVFLNGAQSNSGSKLYAEDIASVIKKCRRSLLCLSLTECKLSAGMLGEIAACTKLRGLILENCELWSDANGNEPTDDNLAVVLRSCTDLRWCFVKSSIFGRKCWEALDKVKISCPKLEVLWVDAPMDTEDRVHVARGDLDTIRSALKGRAGTLKLCMINPDDSNTSRYMLGWGAGTDRLSGRERTEEEFGESESPTSFRGEKYLSKV